MDNKEFIQKLDICLKGSCIRYLWSNRDQVKTTALKKSIRKPPTLKKLNKKNYSFIKGPILIYCHTKKLLYTRKQWYKMLQN